MQGPKGFINIDITKAREKVVAVRAALASPADPSAEVPSNADLMAKLDRIAENMAFKEDVQVAQLETVKQLREEFQSELAPVRVQMGDVETNTRKALDETRMLHERLVAVEQAKILDEKKFAEVNAAIKRLDERLSAA